MKKRLLIVALILALISASGCSNIPTYQVYNFSGAHRINTGYEGSEDEHLSFYEDYQDETAPQTYEIKYNGKKIKGEYKSTYNTGFFMAPQHTYKCGKEGEVSSFVIQDGKVAGITIRLGKEKTETNENELKLSKKEYKNKALKFAGRLFNVSGYEMTEYVVTGGLVLCDFIKMVQGYPSQSRFYVTFSGGEVLNLTSRNPGTYSDLFVPKWNMEKVKEKIASIVEAHFEKRGDESYKGKLDDFTINYMKGKDGKWELLVWPTELGTSFSFVVR